MADDNQGGSELRKLHEGFAEAFRNGDYDALGRFYAEGAIMLPPGGATMSGVDRILGFWQRAQRIQAIQFETSEVKSLGEGALREVGTFQLTMRGQGRQTQAVPAKYVFIWLKVGDAWKLETSIWNRSAPAQQGQQGQRGQGGGRMGGGGGGGGGRMGGGGGGGGRMGGGGGRMGGGGGGRMGGGGMGGGQTGGGSGGETGGGGRGRMGGGGFGRRGQRNTQQAAMVPRID